MHVLALTLLGATLLSLCGAGPLDIVVNVDYFYDKVAPTVGLCGEPDSNVSDLRNDSVVDNWNITEHYVGKGVADRLLDITYNPTKFDLLLSRPQKPQDLKILFTGGHSRKSLFGWVAATILSHMGVKCYLYVIENDDESIDKSRAALHSKLLITYIKAKQSTLYPNINFVQVNKPSTYFSDGYNDDHLVEANAMLTMLLRKKKEVALDAGKTTNAAKHEFEEIEKDLEALYRQFKEIVNFEKLSEYEQGCITFLQAEGIQMIVDGCAPGTTTDDVQLSIETIAPMFIMNNIGVPIVSVDIPSLWSYRKGNDLPEVYRAFGLKAVMPKVILHVGAMKTYVLKQTKHEPVVNMVILPKPLETELEENTVNQFPNILKLLNSQQYKIINTDDITVPDPFKSPYVWSEADYMKLDFIFTSHVVDVNAKELEEGLAQKEILLKAGIAAAQAQKHAKNAPAEALQAALDEYAGACAALKAKTDSSSTFGFQIHASELAQKYAATAST